jgi:hypothetical protein
VAYFSNRTKVLVIAEPDAGEVGEAGAEADGEMHYKADDLPALVDSGRAQKYDGETLRRVTQALEKITL